MKLYLTDGRDWSGTQADAKAAGDNFVQIEVPTDKPNLLVFLQKMQNKITELRERQQLTGEPDGSGAAEEGSTPSLPQPATETPVEVREERPALSTGTLTEQVMELDAKTLIPVLSAAIGRLGEVAGTNGWGAFAKNVYAWSPAARSVEQGLGMLMLAAFDQQKGAGE